MPHPADQLAAALDHSPACVGIDPDIERFPADLRAASNPIDALRAFCCEAVDAVAGIVRVVKPQSACFERFGSRGVQVLEHVCRHARDLGLIVILDAKRGDIGVSARHYAAAAVDLGAHWITVNPYLGMETLEPYLDAGLGIFALVRTSNPGSGDVQTCTIVNGDTVCEHVGRLLARLGAQRCGESGLSSVGAVVGATHTSGGQGEQLRSVMLNQPMLVPGFGAQGGTCDDIAPLRRRGGSPGVIVNASRSVLFPKPSGVGTWQQDIRAAAQSLVVDLTALAR